MNLPDWVVPFIHAAYGAATNPLPMLRNIFTEYEWQWKEYRDDSVPEREIYVSGRSELAKDGWEIVTDIIGDDLPCAAYLIRVRPIVRVE